MNARASLSLGLLLQLLGCQPLAATEPLSRSSPPVAPRSATRSPAPAAPIAPVTAPSLAPPWSADAQRLYERTLVRDPVPSCAALTAGLTDPARALVEVSERAVAPPSSAIRAAACALERAGEVEPALLRWVRTRETLGLGLLVLGQLDRLEAPLAARVVDAALTGPIAAEARPRIVRSTRHPGLRARALEDPITGSADPPPTR
jgi:hypothetical protein